MIGVRAGISAGERAGIAVGVSNDEIGASGKVLVAIIGQSNAQGVGDVTGLSAGNSVYNGPYSAVQFMAKLGDNTDPPATQLNVGPVAVQPEFWQSLTRMGIEMSLMRELDRAIPNQWACGKFANGSTSLFTNWKANGTYPTSQTNLANQAFQYLQSAMATLGCSRIVFIWIQGEADAGSSTSANAYSANLAALVTLSRTYFPAAPWIVGKLNSDFVNAAASAGAFTTTVQAQEASYVGGDANSQLVDMDSVLPGADHTHYTADGYVSLGFLYAPKVMTALGLKGRPQASFSTSITTLTVTFTDTSIDRYSTISSWLWNFGDGNTSTSQNPVHAFAAGGTYSVSLTVTDGNGQSDTTTSNVTVTASAWTSDATSGVAIPQSLTEWNALLTSISDAAGGPAELHLCQEASGNLADSIGAFTQTASGTGITYGNTVPGWAMKFLGFTDAGTGAFATTSASLTDLSTADELVIGYYLINTPALRSIVSLGTPTGSRVALEQRSASNLMVLQDGATANNSTLSPYKSTVQALVLQYSATNSAATYYSVDEKLSAGVFAAGAGKRFGIGNFGRTSPTMNVGYLVRFTGAAARRSSAQIKAILQALKVPGYASIAWS